MPAFLTRQLDKIREINTRYATPRIKMTRPVAFALLLLRLYLIVLVGILVLKFVTMIKG